MSPCKVTICEGFAVCVSKGANGKWRKAWSASPEWHPASPARGPAYMALKARGLAGVNYVMGRKP